MNTKRVLWVDDSYENLTQDGDVIDDEKEVRDNNKSEREHIKKADVTFVLQASTDAALSILTDPVDNRFDCIISDMERGDNERAGLDLIQHVREFDQEIPIIIYTTGKHTNRDYKKLFDQKFNSITNEPEYLLEILSFHLFGNPDKLLQEDPSDEKSSPLPDRAPRYVYKGQSFFESDSVQKRMDNIRSTIELVRANWHDREKVLAEILCYPTGLAPSQRQRLVEYALKATSFDYDWRESAAGGSDTRILSDYTSRFWYARVFGTMNAVFRSSDERITYGDIALSTYILEHLNVSLYNYLHSSEDGSPYPRLHQGYCYRGIELTEKDYNSLAKLSENAISGSENRNFSHPLSLISSSTNLDKAFEFLPSAETGKAEQEDDFESDDSGKPALFKSYIFSMPDEYIDLYKSFFGDSIVSSLCAVDIRQQSYYVAEEEVLLRGPFFEMVHHRPETSNTEHPVPLFESVVLDANRDHIATFAMKGKKCLKLAGNKANSKEDLDGQARYLFGLLARLRRAEICRKYLEEYGDQSNGAYKENGEEIGIVAQYTRKIDGWREEINENFDPEGGMPAADVHADDFKHVDVE